MKALFLYAHDITLPRKTKNKKKKIEYKQDTIYCFCDIHRN